MTEATAETARQTATYDFLRSLTVPADMGDYGAYAGSPISQSIGLHHHGGDEVHVYDARHGKLAEVYPDHIYRLRHDADELFTFRTGYLLPN